MLIVNKFNNKFSNNIITKPVIVNFIGIWPMIDTSQKRSSIMKF